MYAAKKGNGKTAITVKNLIIIMGSGVLFIEEGKEKGTGKEKKITFQAKNLFSNSVFNLIPVFGGKAQL